MLILKKIPKLPMLKDSVFVYPTETCYGLGCDALNAELVKRVYAIKGRARAKQLSWIVADIKMAERYAVFSKRAHALAEKFWPGALTMVLPVHPHIYSGAGANDGNETRALRVSSHKTALSLSRKLNRPIIATSANRSQRGECYSVAEVVEQFRNVLVQPDFIIDGGALPRTLPTTIVEVFNDTTKVIRKGKIVVEL